MGVKVIRPSGRKDWYIQVCEGRRRYLRHVGSQETAYVAKKDIEHGGWEAGEGCVYITPLTSPGRSTGRGKEKGEPVLLPRFMAGVK
jgi:hypothetical protein